MHLVLVVLAAVLPLLLLAGGLAAAYVRAETERFERGVRDGAVAAAIAVDRELNALVTTLSTLGSAPSLAEGRLAEFHAHAAAAKRAIGADIYLRDATGRQVLATRAPYGEAMPAGSSISRWDEEIIAGRRPFVTGHYRGRIDGEHSFAVVVPVVLGGEVRWLLHVSVPTARLRDILLAQRAPPGGGIGLFDRDHVILARRARHDETVGTRSAAAAATVPMTGEEATLRFVGRDGEEVYSAQRRLAGSGWTVAAGAPVRVIEAPLRRRLWAAAGIGAALLALALGGAWSFGNRLARAIRGLAAFGASVEGGALSAPPTTGVREVDETAETLLSAAARQRLMVHELNHRVRNTLAMVDSMVRLSARHAADVQDFKLRLSERIRALAHTHVLLSGAQWRDAELRDVLSTELAAHDAAGSGRVTLDGPDVSLPARLSVAFGMLAHELATNAAKYGALSVPAGRVALRWTSVRDAGAARRLDLEWRESGGPPVQQPMRRGFGSQLIEQAIARDLGARVQTAYAPAGLVFRLSMPLDGSSLL
ncbi:sensor histidine kinase [Falsiroseomonas sp. HW251]|uniref:sensor histidine kinase n=1 Tax=Falsiroseomonas sp. HW251 TaxID=3390998 RepID=UPI003D31C17A